MLNEFEMNKISREWCDGVQETNEPLIIDAENGIIDNIINNRINVAANVAICGSKTTICLWSVLTIGWSNKINLLNYPQHINETDFLIDIFVNIKTHQNMMIVIIIQQLKQLDFHIYYTFYIDTSKKVEHIFIAINIEMHIIVLNNYSNQIQNALFLIDENNYSDEDIVINRLYIVNNYKYKKHTILSQFIFVGWKRNEESSDLVRIFVLLALIIKMKMLLQCIKMKFVCYIKMKMLLQCIIMSIIAQLFQYATNNIYSINGGNIFQ